MLHKNQTLTVAVEDLNNLGFGVAHAEGMTLFVSGAVDGDTVRAKVIKVGKTWAACRCEEILAPSPHRIADTCPYTGCGGCAYRAVSYEHECQLKHRYVDFCFRKAGVKAEIAPLITTGKTDGYRNKAQYAFGSDPHGKAVLGFFAPKSHRVVSSPCCPLQPKHFAQAVAAVLAYVHSEKLTVYNEETGKGLLRHLYLRQNSRSEVLLTLVINGDALPSNESFVTYLQGELPFVVGILLNENRQNTNVVLGKRYHHLWGEAALVDTLAGVKLRLSPDAFYQVNHSAATLLYAKAKELAMPTKRDTVLDLFCGAGSIGLSMAADCREVVGVEIVAEAVENARFNATANGYRNAGFVLADADDPEQFFRHPDMPQRPDIVILDPPRKGCAPPLLTYLADAVQPGKIVYISCGPDTLARDAALLISQGYTMSCVTPVDLFPRTGHCEAICLFTRCRDYVTQ